MQIIFNYFANATNSIEPQNDSFKRYMYKTRNDSKKWRDAKESARQIARDYEQQIISSLFFYFSVTAF